MNIEANMLPDEAGELVAPTEAQAQLHAAVGQLLTTAGVPLTDVVDLLGFLFADALAQSTHRVASPELITTACEVLRKSYNDICVNFVAHTPATITAH